MTKAVQPGFCLWKEALSFHWATKGVAGGPGGSPIFANRGKQSREMERGRLSPKTLTSQVETFLKQGLCLDLCLVEEPARPPPLFFFL